MKLARATCTAAIAAVAVACSSPAKKPDGRQADGTPSKASGTAPGAGDAATATGAPAPALALDPPPPEGVIIPAAVGRVREVRAGRPGDPSVWTAVFEADPADPRVRQILAKDTTTPLRPDRYDAGDAAAILYAEQVKAAGVETHSLEASFDYSIQGGKFDVIVRSDDAFHKGDPDGFSVIVAIPGG